MADHVKSSDSKLRVAHANAGIGHQEKNETTPKRHDRQTRGKLFQGSVFLHDPVQLAMHGGAATIIAGISLQG